MTEAALSSYEELPYTRNPFYTTHPDCLATVALLNGLEPPPTKRCRVLELGCASGGNLIPMAAGLPDGTFVGIDLSPRQIAEGQELVDATGLKNVELRALSIMDVGADFGPFDYIISHGVYSWVPPVVQDRMLQICTDHLTPGGLAGISYNTYPGWHLRGMVRDMLGFHVKQFSDTRMRVRQARAFLDFLSKSVRAPECLYGKAVKEEADMLADETDTYLFHEHLEDTNSPVYFHEFAERLEAKGLQFVGEAQAWALTGDLPAQVKHILDHIAPNRLAREQYLDFLGGRLFRRSVICHAGRTLKPTPVADAIPNLRATALVKPVNPDLNVASADPAEFRATSGVGLTTASPVVKTALDMLYRAWPRSLAFEEILSGTARRLAPAGIEPGRAQLAEVLLNCYQAHLLELHVSEPAFVLKLSERPVAAVTARVLALTEKRVPNLRHCSVELDDFDRLILRHLDGTRDREALLAVLAAAISEGVLELQSEEGVIPSPEQVRALLGEMLDASLQRLANSTLLVS